jgi:hypothetical protein
MQYRRIRLFCILLLASLPLAALAATDEPGETMLRSAGPSDGFGSVFPVPGASEAVEVPAPFASSGTYDDLAWQFPASADPQPTFAPANDNHVYVAAKDSTVTPPDRPLFRCDGIDDQIEINSALATGRGGVVELLDGSFRCSDRIAVPEGTTLRGQGSLETTVEIAARAGGSGYLPIAVGAEHVNVGGFTMRGNAFIMVTRSHVRVQDVRATCVDLDGVWRKASGNGMFFVWVAPPVTVVR